MKEKKYVAEKIENFQAEIPVEYYMKECVDFATFLEFCETMVLPSVYILCGKRLLEQISQNSNYGAKIIFA